MQQMHLAKIGLQRVSGNARAMLDRGTGMRITLNADTGNERQALRGIF